MVCLVVCIVVITMNRNVVAVAVADIAAVAVVDIVVVVVYRAMDTTTVVCPRMVRSRCAVQMMTISCQTSTAPCGRTHIAAQVGQCCGGRAK